MPKITFSTGKAAFLIFEGVGLEAERNPQGMLITASGELTQQDSPLLEQFLPAPRECHVRIQDGGADIINGPFRVTFFEVEADKLTVLLEAA